MIGALGELSPYILWFCLNMRFKGRVPMVYIVLMVYMYIAAYCELKASLYSCMLIRVFYIGVGLQREFLLDNC